MTPTTETPATPPPKPRRRRPGTCVLIRNVDWEVYEKVLAAFGDKHGVRLTYDRGSLEIMAPSMEHEDDAELLGDFAKILAAVFGLPVRNGGAVTLRRKKRLKGIEADRCYWIANAPKVAGVRRLDLAVHPPPDLAIEVDVTNSSLDRFGIYARLGVPELWRLDGDDLRFHVRGPDGKYAEAATSRTFPGIAPADLVPFLKQARAAADQNAISEAFRAWATHRVAAPPAGA